eukprot:4701788-Pyramimonas_sp.AAC.1
MNHTVPTWPASTPPPSSAQKLTARTIVEQTLQLSNNPLGQMGRSAHARVVVCACVNPSNTFGFAGVQNRVPKQHIQAQGFA